MIKKTNYETPLAELLVVRFEDDLLQASNYGAKGAAGGDIEDGNEYEL